MKYINSLYNHLVDGTLWLKIRVRLKQYFLGGKLTPIGNNYVGEKALIYDDHRQNDPYWILEHEALREFIHKNRVLISSVLDAPYGTGRFASIYHDVNFNVFGLDISSEMVNVAKKKQSKFLSKTTFHIQDFRNIPHPDNSIDLVVCYRFLPWIVSLQDAEDALVEFSRVCKKYAVFELCVGKHISPMKNIKKSEILWNNYNEEELRNWLKNYGFETMEVKFLFDDEQHPGLSIFYCQKNQLVSANGF